MHPSDIYQDAIYVKESSILSGKTTRTISLKYLLEKCQDPILNAFANDNHIQEITLTSTSMGFNRTYSKDYKDKETK